MLNMVADRLGITGRPSVKEVQRPGHCLYTASCTYDAMNHLGSVIMLYHYDRLRSYYSPHLAEV